MFLAAAVPARPGETLVEAGLGTGAAAIAVLTRVTATRLVGIERHGPHAALARRNAEANRLVGRLAVIEADIAALRPGDLAAAVPPPPYDHAFANPPYHEDGRARRGATASKSAAHAMPAGALAGWVASLAALLRDGGTATFIHRPEAMAELLAAMARAFGAIAVLPLAPAEGAPATRIVVQGRKSSRAPLRLLTPLVLHGPGGVHTSRAEAVLRHGEALDLS
jgi:tRNA1(Val) A37 N6-methylase TrmN6